VGSCTYQRTKDLSQSTVILNYFGEKKQLTTTSIHSYSMTTKKTTDTNETFKKNHYSIKNRRIKFKEI
jgi:hypothetical protein